MPFKWVYLALDPIVLKFSKKGETDDSLMRMLSEWHKNVSEWHRAEIVTLRVEAPEFFLHHDSRRLQSEQCLFANTLVINFLKREIKYSIMNCLLLSVIFLSLYSARQMVKNYSFSYHLLTKKIYRICTAYSLSNWYTI